MRCVFQLPQEKYGDKCPECGYSALEAKSSGKFNNLHTSVYWGCDVRKNYVFLNNFIFCSGVSLGGVNTYFINSTGNTL